MYLNDTKKHLLVRVLRKKGWSILQKRDTWLVKGTYTVHLKQETFILYCDVKRGGTLIKIGEFDYGRRQSQRLERAVSKHDREARRCMSTNSNFRGER